MRTFIVLVALLTATVASAQVTKETVPGITNFSQGRTRPSRALARRRPAAVAEVKRLGYASIINLRQASESGAEVDAEAAAAKVANITYIQLPFNTASPDPAVVDQFITAVTAPANQPVFVHCASANRAAALWMIKRMTVDGWDADRAGTEATALGLTRRPLKTFRGDRHTATKERHEEVASRPLSERGLRRRLRPAAWTYASSPCADIESDGLVADGRPQREDEAHELQQHEAHDTAVDDRGENGGRLNPELPRIAEEQSVGHAVERLLREDARQQRADRAAETVRGDDVERVVEIGSGAPQQREVAGERGDAAERQSRSSVRQIPRPA